MWILEQTNASVLEGRQRKCYCLPLDAQTPFTCGRKDTCSIVLDNDTSVSRVHAKVRISSSDKTIQISDLKSSYGTFVNDVQIPANTFQSLNAGDVIRFGALPKSPSVYQLRCVEIKVCFSSLKQSVKETLKKQCETLGIEAISNWDSSCSHLIMPSFTTTEKAILALIQGKCIVTPAFIQDLHDQLYNNGNSNPLLNSSFSIPDPNSYIPECNDPNLSKMVISIGRDEKRRNLFDSITFLTFDESEGQLARIENIVKEAAGVIILVQTTSGMGTGGRLKSPSASGKSISRNPDIASFFMSKSQVDRKQIIRSVMELHPNAILIRLPEPEQKSNAASENSTLSSFIEEAAINMGRKLINEQDIALSVVTASTALIQKVAISRSNSFAASGTKVKVIERKCPETVVLESSSSSEGEEDKVKEQKSMTKRKAVNTVPDLSKRLKSTTNVSGKQSLSIFSQLSAVSSSTSSASSTKSDPKATPTNVTNTKKHQLFEDDEDEDDDCTYKKFVKKKNLKDNHLGGSNSSASLDPPPSSDSPPTPVETETREEEYCINPLVMGKLSINEPTTAIDKTYNPSLSSEKGKALNTKKFVKQQLIKTTQPIVNKIRTFVINP